MKIRRGTQAEIDAIVLAEGEFAFTTDTKRIYIGDGSTNVAVGGEGALDIDDMTDVVITSVGDGEVLVYDSGTSSFINQTFTEASIPLLTNVVLRDGTQALTASWDVGAYVITTDGLISLNIRLDETTKPSNVANTGFVYTKDDGGDTELYYEDDGGAEVQITQDGSLFGAGGDMLKSTYDSDTDGLIDAAAGGTELDTSSSTGVPIITGGTWSTETQLALARGGTGIDTSATAKGSIFVFDTAGVVSIISGTTTGHVPTIQADDTILWAAPAGTGDMLKATYDADTDGTIDAIAGGTELDTSGSTGIPRIDAGTWSVIKDNWAAGAGPTVNDDDVGGYAIGSYWIDTTNDEAYVCSDATTGAAVWKQTTASLAAHTLDSASHSDVAAIVEAQGQVLYYDGADWNALGVGVAGYFLQTRGAAADPVWASGTGSSPHSLDGGQHTNVTIIAEAQGMILYVDGTPEWNGLAVGTDKQVLQTQGAGANPQWVDGILADGTQALSANWDVGAYTITALTYVSDQATGTAPFTVASTTIVTNLNVDQVDGKDSTDFVLVDGTQALTANWDVGAYTITALTYVSDQATGTAPFTVASTTVVPNLNVDQVDGADLSTAVVASPGSDVKVPSEQAVREAITQQERTVMLQVIAHGTALTTGNGKMYWPVPEVLNGMNLTSAGASVLTVSSGGTPTFQIHNVTDGVDMLSTEVTIDATEYDSATADTPSVVDGGNDDVVTGDRLRFDCDVAGTGTKGWWMKMTFETP
jgi:hypothetical protein